VQQRAQRADVVPVDRVHPAHEQEHGKAREGVVQRAEAPVRVLGLDADAERGHVHGVVGGLRVHVEGELPRALGVQRLLVRAEPLVEVLEHDDVVVDARDAHAAQLEEAEVALEHAQQRAHARHARAACSGAYKPRAAVAGVFGRGRWRLRCEACELFNAREVLRWNLPAQQSEPLQHCQFFLTHEKCSAGQPADAEDATIRTVVIFLNISGKCCQHCQMAQQSEPL